jgi:hypothetical protein
VSTEEFRSQVLARHEAAAEILRVYDETRAPYVVYLRKFSVDVFHGPDEANRALVEDTLREDLPSGAGLFTERLSANFAVADLVERLGMLAALTPESDGTRI